MKHESEGAIDFTSLVKKVHVQCLSNSQRLILATKKIALLLYKVKKLVAHYFDIIMGEFHSNPLDR